MDEKFHNLEQTHLIKEGLIGPNEPYATVIDYASTELPKYAGRFSKLEDASTKAGVLLKQFQGRLSKALGTEIPNQISALYKDFRADDKKIKESQIELDAKIEFIKKELDES